MVIKTNGDYLAHHGILGQKWGDRNGPPYPLYREGKYSSAEKKAGLKESIKTALDNRGSKNRVEAQNQFYRTVKGGSSKSKLEKKAEKIVKKDSKWIDKHEEKIKRKAFNKSEKELRKYVKQLNKQPDSYLSTGQISNTYINNYNRKLAELMNKNVGDIAAPSGRVVRFVAKRGEVGVYTALVYKDYDMSNVKNGLWDDARIGYKQQKVKTL